MKYENKHLNERKSFWSSKKNIIIVILCVIAFSYIIYLSDSNKSDNNAINNITENSLNNFTNISENLFNTINISNESTIVNSTSNNITNNTKTNITSETKKTTTNNISSNKETSNTSKNTTKNNSKMVWVGETGSKYHNEGCRTLKGKGHQITLDQAKKEGRQPCKVCH